MGMWLAAIVTGCAAIAAGGGGGDGAKGGEVWPDRDWSVRRPGDMGLDEARLRAFAERIGGRGCVVRRGCMVFAWGDASKRGDVASAAKPIYAHFLFKAVEDGRLAGPDGFRASDALDAFDAKVSRYEPRLGRINAALGHKDAEITFRHLANQTACYGLAERPGTAFAYNDWQMALFWDVLFLKVYGATYETVDEKVLRPLLAGPLGCQDEPTMLAFGASDRPGRVAISPRDFCRFGLLYLRRGQWSGKQLITAEHAALATASPLPNSIPRAGKRPAEMIPGQRSIGSKVIPDNQTDHIGSYSWLWWTNGVDREGKRHWPDAPADAFGAFGHGGRRAMVILPGLDIVASWNDAGIEGRDKENEAIGLLAASARDAAASRPARDCPDPPSYPD